MTRISALVADTIREIYSKKIIVGLMVVEAIILVVTALVLFQEGMQAEYAEARELSVVVPGESGRGRASSRDARRDSTWVTDSLALLSGDSLATPGDASTAGGSAVFGTDSGAGSPTIQANVSDASPALLEKVRGQLGAFPVFITLGVLFLGLFATAGVVPSMMERGTIELLLSKPLGRPLLLLGRMLGGIGAITLNHALFVICLWTLFGLASGIWLTSFLLWTIIIPLFSFVTVYCGVVLLSILSGSWVLPVSIAYLHLMILSGLLYARESTLYVWVDNIVVHWLADALYWGLPQVSNLSSMTMESVYASSFESWTPFIQGVLFILISGALAVWRFERKDF